MTARDPPPGLTRKQWRRLQTDADTAKPVIRTALTQVERNSARPVNRQAARAVAPSRNKTR
jgi:hypothetical protein